MIASLIVLVGSAVAVAYRILLGLFIPLIAISAFSLVFGGCLSDCFIACCIESLHTISNNLIKSREFLLNYLQSIQRQIPLGDAVAAGKIQGFIDRLTSPRNDEHEFLSTLLTDLINHFEQEQKQINQNEDDVERSIPRIHYVAGACIFPPPPPPPSNRVRSYGTISPSAPTQLLING